AAALVRGMPRPSSPSPRLPLGRLRPSSTGYGEGRGEGPFPQTRTSPPSSDSWRGPLTRNLREERANSDLSPRAGRGEGRGGTLDELEGYALLDRLGIRHAPSVALDANTEEAPTLPFGYPVVLKALSSAITHKSDVGGVTLGIPDATTLGAAIAAMRTRLTDLRRILVQPMIAGIGEVLIGYRADPDVGPLVLVAAGGIYTEIYRDRSLRLAPVDPD